MKTKKRFLAVVLAAALLVAGLTGCKDALRGVAQKISGSSGEVQEEDTTRWADATADPLIIQGIADASAKFDTAMVDGTLYAVFNGIWSRQTCVRTSWACCCKMATASCLVLQQVDVRLGLPVL